MLRCWLLAIGQAPEDVSAWLVDGVKLGDRSLGAVNVEGPKRRWGGTGKQWKRNKLAAYLTKYIGKEFEDTDKHAKKYWHSDNVGRPVVTRFWLRSQTFADAVVEAHDLIFFRGATSLSMWGDDMAGVVWITGETERSRVGQVLERVADLEK